MGRYCKWMELEVLERLRFLASLPLAGTAQTERGGIRVANNRIISHPFTLPNQNLLYRKQVNHTLLKRESAKTDSPKPHIAKPAKSILAI